MERRMTWAIEHLFEGWTCSECAWTYPIPELLVDPHAKNAYDRIASANFKSHDCRATPKGRKPLYEEANIERLRMLVMRFKTEGRRRNTASRGCLGTQQQPKGYGKGSCGRG
jgi:hypothetical protein